MKKPTEMKTAKQLLAERGSTGKGKAKAGKKTNGSNREKAERVPPPTIVMDHDVTEILCKPTAITIATEKVEVEEGVFEEQVMGGTMTFTDVDGGAHEVTFEGKTPVFRLFQKVSKYEKAMELFDMKPKERNAFLNSAFKDHEPIIARVLPDDSLFATVTQVWKRNDIEAVLPIIKDEFKGADIEVIPSDGMYGGKAIVDLTKSDLLQEQVVVTMGPKDGGHAVKVLAGGFILSCLNQLSADVRHEVIDHLPKTTQFYLAQKHSSQILDEAFLRGELMNAKAAASELTAMLKESQKMKLSDEQALNILRYYNVEGILSAKSARAIGEMLSSKEITQKPGTVYGLAMAITYFGTHGEDLKDGVRSWSHRLGCELVLVTSNWDKYQEVVASKTKALDKDIFAEEPEEPDMSGGQLEAEDVPKPKKAKTSKKVES